MKGVRLFLIFSLAFLPGFAAHAQNGFYSSMVAGQCKADGTSQNFAHPEDFGHFQPQSNVQPQNIVAGFSWNSSKGYSGVGVNVVVSNQPGGAQSYILNGRLVVTSVNGVTTGGISKGPGKPRLVYRVTLKIVRDATGNAYQTVNNLFSGLTLLPGTYSVLLDSPTSIQWQATNGSEVPTPDGLNGITDGGAIDQSAGTSPNNPVLAPWWSSHLAGRHPDPTEPNHNAALCFDVHGTLLPQPTTSIPLPAEWIWLNKTVSCTLGITSNSLGSVTYSVGLPPGVTRGQFATVSSSGGTVHPNCSGIGSSSGEVLTISSYGQFTLTATQAGTDLYQPASVTQIVNIANPLVAVPHTP